MTLCCYAALLRYVAKPEVGPCTEVTIGTPRLCIVLVNTQGVQSDEVKDKVFHALVNPRIPLSDRQENNVPRRSCGNGTKRNLGITHGSDFME